MHEIYAFFDLNQLDKSTLEHYMQYLPPERKVKALRYRQEIDKKTCVAAYLLLFHGLYVSYGICKPRLSYSNKGKPFLPDYPNIHFNISHCPNGCICGISDSPIGVDIQDVRPFSQKVADRCCTEDELHRLKQAADPASEFTRMWVMKESYLKMTGDGITENLSAIDTIKRNHQIQTFTGNGCYIAVAYAESFREESICMN